MRSLLNDPTAFQKANSPVYGENKVIIQYRVRDLLWRPAGRMVRFVAVIHPARGSFLLMCTDTSLDAIDIIRLYGLRFKIELSFKQAVHQIGTFTYHFWMFDMKPLRRNDGNQHLHRASLKYRNDVKRKLHAYHVFIQAGLVCQGLLQYLSVAFPRLVWSSFGSWLRTIRPGIPPSELVVATALRQRLPEFLLNATKTTSSRNSSPNDRTPTKCRPSDSPPERKFCANPGLTSKCHCDHLFRRWCKRAEGSLPIGRSFSSRHNLVFGRSVRIRNHDATMGIGGEAPGRRVHSRNRHGRPWPAADHRHLGSSSAVRRARRTSAETACDLLPLDFSPAMTPDAGLYPAVHRRW